MGAWKQKLPSIVDTLKPTDPLYIACRQPQLMYVRVQNYGLAKLYDRLKNKKHSRRTL